MTLYNEDDFTNIKLEVHQLRNMFVTRSMLIGNPKGIHNSSFTPSMTPDVKNKFNFVFWGSMIKNKLHFLENKDYYFISHIWGNGYYHWLIEVAPKLFLFEEMIKSGVLLFPSSTPHFIREFLDAWEFKNIRFYDENCFVRKLKVIDSPNSWQYNKKLLLEFKGRVFQKTESKKTDLPSKIYVSRKNARARKVVNEEELIDKLEKEGFYCLETDKLSFIEQVNIFKNCKHFISIHGAALTDSIFMPIGSKIIELFPKIKKEDISDCYYRLAQTLGHEHRFVWCERENPKKTVNLDTDNVIADIQTILRD